MPLPFPTLYSRSRKVYFTGYSHRGLKLVSIEGKIKEKSGGGGGEEMKFM